MSLKSDFIHFFLFHDLYMYIASRQGQTAPGDKILMSIDVFCDLITEGKCDHRIANLLIKVRHHRDISVVYLTQNFFPQGKTCRDIALNTQCMVLFNNPIDRQQVATLARRIYLSTGAIFMKRLEQAISHPYGYLVRDLKSSTPEKDKLHTKIFEKRKCL